MVWMLWLAIALALIAITAVLTAGEAALNALSRAELTELAETSRHPERMRKIAADPEAYTTATLFARIGLETIAVVVVTLTFARELGTGWATFFAAAGTMLLVSFLVTGTSPRSIGRTHPRATAIATSGLMRASRLSVGALADLLAAIGDAITPGRGRRADAVSSEEQLLSMVDEAAEREVLDDEDRELIHSVFEFSDRRVREVMVARTDMVTVDGDASVEEALTQLLEAGISRAPMIGRDSDDVLGMLYQKDLARALLIDRTSNATPASALRRAADFVPETLPADALLRHMQQGAIHVAMVVDEYGGIAGLVTLEDLIEELVGEIADEYDRADAAAELLPDGGFRISTRRPTGELGELFGLDLEFDDVDSVGGLFAKALGKVPARGDVAIVDGLQLQAERIGRRGRVETVIASLVPEPAAEGDALDRPLPDNVSEALAERRASRHERKHHGDHHIDHHRSERGTR